MSGSEYPVLLVGKIVAGLLHAFVLPMLLWILVYE